MSQNSRNKPGEGQENRGRSAEPEDRKRYEGFEGMNYEQRRQPFIPQRNSNNRNQEEVSERRKGGNER